MSSSMLAKQMLTCTCLILVDSNVFVWFHLGNSVFIWHVLEGSTLKVSLKFVQGASGKAHALVL